MVACFATTNCVQVNWNATKWLVSDVKQSVCAVTSMTEMNTKHVHIILDNGRETTDEMANSLQITQIIHDRCGVYVVSCQDKLFLWRHRKACAGPSMLKGRVTWKMKHSWVVYFNFVNINNYTADPFWLTYIHNMWYIIHNWNNYIFNAQFKMIKNLSFLIIIFPCFACVVKFQHQSW